MDQAVSVYPSWSGLSSPVPPYLIPRAGNRTGVAYQRPVNGVYRAGSDPRKDGHAGGW